MADFDEHRPRAARNARAPPTDDAPYVSDEVRAMMHAFESSLAPPTTDEPVHTTPQIYYASRTHSQLAQLIHELKRTPFGHDAHDVVRTISLGSRRQMCINAHVQRVGATFGMEAMNERCLELMESRSRTSPTHAEKRCPYLPPADAAGDAKMDTFRDHALVRALHSPRHTSATSRSSSRSARRCTCAPTLAHAAPSPTHSSLRCRTTCSSSRTRARRSRCTSTTA